MWEALFREHIQERLQCLEMRLSEVGYDGLLIYSGSNFVYFADDREAPFRPTPHFSHWCPERSAGNYLHLRPGHKPKLYLFKPKDFWHEVAEFQESYWTDSFEILECPQADTALSELTGLKNHAYIGPKSEPFTETFAINPKDLLARLDWDRCKKTAYEVACVAEANRIASLGHNAARSAFAQGGSELDIHYAYIQALRCVDEDLPYSAIVCLDEKSAVLHYQHKRPNGSGRVCLIDSGALHFGYASDITRTYAKTRGTHPVFISLLEGMEDLQQSICSRVQEGYCYGDLQLETHKELAALLLRHDILQNITTEEALDKLLTRTFFPHGLGHALGLQVHDVGGRQKNPQGDKCEVDTRFPTLRFVRPLRAGEILTVEPGLYFIRMLLEEARAKEDRRFYHWTLIDELVPFGGIRIEDNVHVLPKGNRNLTREVLGSEIVLKS